MMSNTEYYHFHKDCKYYPQCTETPVKYERHECIQFECPVAGKSLYYKNDLHTIKWECTMFEPYQESLFKEESE